MCFMSKLLHFFFTRLVHDLGLGTVEHMRRINWTHILHVSLKLKNAVGLLVVTKIASAPLGSQKVN